MKANRHTKDDMTVNAKLDGKSLNWSGYNLALMAVNNRKLTIY